jgi:hypothetical protein
LGGTKRDLGELCFCHGFFLSDLVLDLSENYYQTPFCSL